MHKIYAHPKSYDIPQVDLLTLLFDNVANDVPEHTPLHAEADAPHRILTKSSARTYTKKIAHGLRTKFNVGAHGAGKDVVIVTATGNAFLPVVFYGIIAAGGVYSAASPSFTVAELVRQIEQGKSNLIICNADTRDVAIKAANQCGVALSRVLVVESVPKWSLRSVNGNESAISHRELDWVRVTDQRELEDSVICLLYSSGTTGQPKGVLVSHMNVVSEAYIPATLARQYDERQVAAGGKATVYRTLAHLPVAHVAGLQGYYINPVFHGGLTYWMPKFDFAKFLEYNKKFQITMFFTVPPIYLLIAKSDAVKDHFDSLEIAYSGAAPLGAVLQNAASAKLGKGKTFISQTWGLSETTGSVTYMPRGEKDDTGSVSPLLPNTSMRIVDDDGKDVEEGKPGEVLIKAPMVTKGYHDNLQATKEAFVDGWFCTGDIAELRDGKIYIVDRKKELIKYKGLQVAPAELEALLISHPKILDAAVIGVEAEGTEVPRGYIVADQKTISAEEIKDYVKDNVAGYKQLRGGVIFLDAIPKSASGKILRKDLRALAQRGAKL